jgi:cytidylate kinase
MSLNIAIDGPAGSGKSTVAKAVSEALNITYLDTGAMYRMVTLNVLNENIDFEDEKKIQKLLDDIKIEFINQRLLLNGKDVTETIRNSEVAKHVSKIAAISEVRKKLVKMQQEIAKGQNIVMDGRDIGTHVLPDAEYKFFLVASVEERARRRMEDFNAQKIQITMKELMDDIQNRDQQDMNRVVSPLKQAEDAILIDTTHMTIKEVIDFILEEIKS